jgi:hypothetical protein
MAAPPRLLQSLAVLLFLSSVLLLAVSGGVHGTRHQLADVGGEHHRHRVAGTHMCATCSSSLSVLLFAQAVDRSPAPLTLQSSHESLSLDATARMQGSIGEMQDAVAEAAGPSVGRGPSSSERAAGRRPWSGTRQRPHTGRALPSHGRRHEEPPSLVAQFCGCDTGPRLGQLSAVAARALIVAAAALVLLLRL